MRTIRPDQTKQPPGNLWAQLNTAKLMMRYDPFRALGLTRRDLAYYRQAKAESVYAPPNHRRPSYSRNRIAWLLRHGWEDPIEVDWVWRGSTPAYLVVVDGHHRLCAAVLANDESVLVSYSGPIEEIKNLS